MTGRYGSFRYDRQFALLFGLALVLLTAGDWIPVHGALVRFGLYGALYSGALAVTVRGAASVGRRLMFLALGSLLSAANAGIGLEAAHLPDLLPGVLGREIILVSCAGLGAAAYSMLVRFVWSPALTATALLAATLGCMLAVQGVLMLHLAAPAGGAWVAVCWWFAFSLALWYHERPEIAIPG
jgi:hypothetical protein